MLLNSGFDNFLHDCHQFTVMYDNLKGEKILWVMKINAQLRDKDWDLELDVLNLLRKKVISFTILFFLDHKSRQLPNLLNFTMFVMTYI